MQVYKHYKSIKFVRFYKDKLLFTYISQGHQYSNYMTFSSFEPKRALLVQYNRILRTIPKHILYENCLLNNEVALRLRDMISKGILSYEKAL